MLKKKKQTAAASQSEQGVVVAHCLSLVRVKDALVGSFKGIPLSEATDAVPFPWPRAEERLFLVELTAAQVRRVFFPHPPNKARSSLAVRSMPTAWRCTMTRRRACLASAAGSASRHASLTRSWSRLAKTPNPQPWPLSRTTRPLPPSWASSRTMGASGRRQRRKRATSPCRTPAASSSAPLPSSWARTRCGVL